MSLENIISKYLLNRTDQNELVQLKAWQAEAKENVRALEEMQEIFALDMSGFKSYDTEKAWDSVESKMSGQKPQEDSGNSYDNVFRLKRWMMSAVAFFGLIAGTSIVWQNYTTEKYPYQYAATTSQEIAELPDKSVVNLDKGATLDIVSEDFSIARSLSLQGRAFFSVAKNGDSPFTIGLPQGKITVLGTQFNITANDDAEEILVTEGHVRYDIEGRSFDLYAGDYIRVIDGDVIKVKMKDPNYLSWKSGKLILDNVGIDTAIKNLSLHYQSGISLSPELVVSDCKISTTLDQETLLEALEELSILFSIKHEVVDDHIVITDIKC